MMSTMRRFIHVERGSNLLDVRDDNQRAHRRREIIVRIALEVMFS